jgi:hypothetical protein
MSLWEEFKREVKSKSSKNTEPRPLTEEDVAGFLKAAGVRKPSIPRQDMMISLLRRNNFWRWHQVQKDFRWMKKVLRKNGYDPEEARWLL